MVWQPLDKPWHDTSVEYCDVCGNLLIRRYWEFQDENGRPIRACQEDDEDLYGRLRVYRARAKGREKEGGKDARPDARVGEFVSGSPERDPLQVGTGR